MLQTHFTTTPSEKPVVYLLITDATLIEAAEVDGISWPWPRSAYAEAIRFLRAAGAKEIVFDMIFTERSVYPTFRTLDFCFRNKVGDIVFPLTATIFRGIY